MRSFLVQNTPGYVFCDQLANDVCIYVVVLPQAKLASAALLPLVLGWDCS